MMKIAFVGATELTLMTARRLIDRGHHVVVIDPDKAKVDEPQGELDCDFLQGDGTRPAILREVPPQQTDVLLCPPRHDHINIMAGLVARSLGFLRIITQIEEPEFDRVCRQVGLKNTIVRSLTISAGADTLDLSTIVKDEARFFRLEVTESEPEHVRGLDLPAGARLICPCREGKFALAAEDTRLHAGDEAEVLTHSKHLPEPCERWPATVTDERVGTADEELPA